MPINSIESMLHREEKEVLHAYQDHLGYWTIGVGILIDKRKGGGLLPEESAFILSNRVRITRAKIIAALPWFTRLTEPRQAVLVGMAYQMGVSGLLKFVNTLKHVERGQYDMAANGIRASLWAKQTPARAERMAQQMTTGEWQQ